MRQGSDIKMGIPHGRFPFFRIFYCGNESAPYTKFIEIGFPWLDFPQFRMWTASRWLTKENTPWWTTSVLRVFSRIHCNKCNTCNMYFQHGDPETRGRNKWLSEFLLNRVIIMSYVQVTAFIMEVFLQIFLTEWQPSIVEWSCAFRKFSLGNKRLRFNLMTHFEPIVLLEKSS